MRLGFGTSSSWTGRRSYRSGWWWPPRFQRGAGGEEPPPSIYYVPPYKGELRIRGGGPLPPAGAAENPLLTAAFRRLSSRHHLVAVGRAWTALIRCSIQLWRVCASVVKSLFFRREEFVLQVCSVCSPALRNKHLRRGHPRCHIGSSRSSRVIYCTLLHFIALYCTLL